MIQQVHNRRAEILRYNDHIRINIRAKRNPLVVILLAGWMFVWFFGEVFGIVGFGAPGAMGSGAMPMMLWMALWTAGGVLAFRQLLWSASGRR